jgi:hypothetical protein
LTVTIKPAVFRDASFITANLRPIDYAEAFCQLPDGATTIELAWWLLHSGDAFIAYLDEEPVFFFGTSPMTSTCYSVWGLGTRNTRRVIVDVTRFLMTTHIEKRIAEGARTMEARSILDHHEAHGWIRSCGGEALGEPFEYGKAGELFVLFRFTVAGYRAMRDKRWSKAELCA